MKGHKRRRCLVRKTFMLENGSFYCGSVYDDLPSGHGRLEHGDRIYEGEFLKGKRHGHGVETGARNYRYDGGWEHDKYHGSGILVRGGNVTYEGTFRHGQYHGKGTLVISDNEWYRGEWSNGMHHGTGTRKNADGSYHGDFYYNLRHGRGAMSYADGTVYIGQWRRNLCHGKGLLTKDDETYAGNFVSGKQSGHGKWESETHGTYVGQWKHGKRHFKGTHTFADGSEYCGGWIKDMRTGYGKMTYGDGTTYKGFWAKDKRHGRGTYVIQESSFEGEWYQDKREGMFVETEENGDTSTGQWVHDLRHGTFEFCHDGTKTRQLYIWGRRKDFKSQKSARKYAIRLLKRNDFPAVEEVFSYYPSMATWKMLYKHDTNGNLVHVLNAEVVITHLKSYAWRLFRNSRFTFIEQCMRKCSDSQTERMIDDLPIFFDTITHDFVANPWIVGHVSYCADTRKKLLSGLHLGEIGRCPPKDPYTRQPMTETSGTWLFADKKTAKKKYTRFMNIIGLTKDVQDLAFEFDLQDFQTSIQNARLAQDSQTIRRLMEERNTFIKRQRVLSSDQMTPRDDV